MVPRMAGGSGQGWRRRAKSTGEGGGTKRATDGGGDLLHGLHAGSMCSMSRTLDRAESTTRRWTRNPWSLLLRSRRVKEEWGKPEAREPGRVDQEIRGSGVREWEELWRRFEFRVLPVQSTSVSDETELGPRSSGNKREACLPEVRRFAPNHLICRRWCVRKAPASEPACQVGPGLSARVPGTEESSSSAAAGRRRRALRLRVCPAPCLPPPSARAPRIAPRARGPGP